MVVTSLWFQSTTFFFTVFSSLSSNWFTLRILNVCELAWLIQYGQFHSFLTSPLLFGRFVLVFLDLGFAVF